jgi:sigma-B regulation protein RsbU (phosphoserine phosphatase)
MAVPIRANGKVIGAFNLESDQLNAYTRYDLEILMFFANQAAISIEKAMLHQALMEKKRLEAELAVAQRVQQSLLPKTDPTFGIYEIAGFNISTAEVGGDYFDFIRVGDAHLGVVIADVAGKGVPAALIMASFRASLRAQLCEECTLSRTFRQMNVMLRESGSTDQYVTSLYLNLSPTDYTFSYLNAGHNRPLIIHPDGSYECLDQANTVLGLLPNQRYDEFSHHVTPGDIIVMYTDGITEANRNGEEFGIKRLANSTYQHASLSASLLVRAIYQDVCDFSPCLTDDCTLVVLKVS